MSSGSVGPTNKPAPATATEIGILDGSGKLQGVSSTNPLPITGTTANNESVGATGAAVPAKGTYIAASVAGTLTGLVATASGLKTDGSAVTQPVSGTVTANAGTGTFTVGGTVTANIGTAGTLALDATLAKLTIAQATALGSTTGPMAQGSVTTSAPTYTTGQINPLSLTTAGALRTDSSAASQPVKLNDSAGSAITNGQQLMAASVPVVLASNQTAVPISGSITATNASIAATGGAVPASATYVGMTIAGTLTGMVGTSNGLKVDGSAVTQPVSGTITANAGTGTLTTDQTTAAATFQAEGSITGAALTNAYATAFTTGGAMKWLGLRNSTDNQVSVSLDAGTTTHFVLDIGDSITIDLKENGMNIATSTAIKAKYSGSATTSGSIRVNGAY